MSSTVSPRRNWKWWVRSLHLYLSLGGVVLMLFFGATGFVMNHEDWFGLDDSREETTQGTIPVELLVEPDKLAVVELLRSRYGVTGRVRKFKVAEAKLRIEFRKPGRSVDAAISRDDGSMTLETETSGMLEILAELHQGKHTGSLGSLVIDMAAATLLIAALTGITLWLTLPKRRHLGIAALVLAILLFGSFYWYVV